MILQNILGQLLVVLRITFFIFKLSFCFKDFIKIVRLLWAAVSIHGLKVEIQYKVQVRRISQ